MLCDPAGVEHRALNGMAIFCDPAGVKTALGIALPIVTPAESQKMDSPFAGIRPAVRRVAENKRRGMVHPAP